MIQPPRFASLRQLLRNEDPHHRLPVPDASRMPADIGAGMRAVHVETVVPVHNEQDDLPRAVQALHEYLVGQFPFRTVVTIAGSGSTDRTCEIAASLAARLPGVRLVRIEQPGGDYAPGPLLRVEPSWAQPGGTVLHQIKGGDTT